LLDNACMYTHLYCFDRPHMQKLYGDEIRKEAGLTKTLRTAIHQLPASNEIAKKFVREQVNGKEVTIEKTDPITGM
jgi:hypothetical protein